MTIVNTTFYDSGNTPLVGFVTVKLADSLIVSTADATHLPVIHKKTLVAGSADFTLEPSDIAKVTYLFEVYQTHTIQIPDEDGVLVDALVDTLIDSYNVIVPFSVTPIQLESLTVKTGIDRDRTDTMIPAVVRRMYTDSQFWVSLQDELFPFKGNYSSSVYYRKGNLVSYDGSGWICTSDAPIIAQTPVIGSVVWGLWVAKGDTGSGVNGNDTAYDVTSWNGSLVAPSRNAVRDKIEDLITFIAANYVGITSPAFQGAPTLVSAPATSDRSSKLVSSAWVGTLYDDAKNSGNRVGSLLLFPSASRPLGYIKCGTGATLDVSQTTYSLLYAVYGTTFGATSGGNFKLPSAAQLPTLPSATLSWYVFTGRND